MSYDIYLNGADGEPLMMDEAFTEGGTYALGGTRDCELNVTYNYSSVYRLVDFSVRDLHGLTGAETSVFLRALVEKLGTSTYEDYWAPTPGNAGAALARLLSFAEAHPEGVWEVH